MNQLRLLEGKSNYPCPECGKRQYEISEGNSAGFNQTPPDAPLPFTME